MDRLIKSELQPILGDHFDRFQIRGFIQELQRMHTNLSAKKAIRHAVQNPYVLAQMMDRDSMERLDAQFAHRGDLQGQRIQAFLHYTCQNYWNGGAKWLGIQLRRDNRVLQSTARHLAEHGPHPRDFYLDELLKNFVQYVSAKRTLDWPTEVRVSEDKIGRRWVNPIALEMMEAGLCKRLLLHANRENMATPDGWEEFLQTFASPKLDDEQKHVLSNIWRLPVSVVTGGPGTGKTSLQGVLGKAIQKFEPNALIIGVSPTGKAAHRLGEVIEQEAYTIHRLLGLYSDDAPVSTNSFPIPQVPVWLLVDEAGTANLRTMYKLLLAMPDDHPLLRIVLIGDRRQLDPVGYGKPFAVLCDHSSWRDRVFKLETIHRSDDDIALAAKDFWDADKPWRWSRQIQRVICSLEDRTEHIRTWIDAHGGREAETWQILTKRRQLSKVERGNKDTREKITTLDINEIVLNEEPALSPGQRIIQLKNNYDTKCMNGESGMVVSASREWITARFAHDEITLPNTPMVLEEWGSAYAITIHKAQGSEWDDVLIVLPDITERSTMSPSELYTAFTRAKRSVTILGTHPDEQIEHIRSKTNPSKTKVQNSLFRKMTEKMRDTPLRSISDTVGVGKARLDDEFVDFSEFDEVVPDDKDVVFNEVAVTQE